MRFCEAQLLITENSVRDTANALVLIWKSVPFEFVVADDSIFHSASLLVVESYDKYGLYSESASSLLSFFLRVGQREGGV